MNMNRNYEAIVEKRIQFIKSQLKEKKISKATADKEIENYKINLKMASDDVISPRWEAIIKKSKNEKRFKDHMNELSEKYLKKAQNMKKNVEKREDKKNFPERIVDKIDRQTATNVKKYIVNKPNKNAKKTSVDIVYETLWNMYIHENMKIKVVKVSKDITISHDDVILPATKKSIYNQYFNNDMAELNDDSNKPDSSAELKKYAFKTAYIYQNGSDLAKSYVPITKTVVKSPKVIDYAFTHADDLNIPPENTGCLEWAIVNKYKKMIKELNVKFLIDLMKTSCKNVNSQLPCKCEKNEFDWEHAITFFNKYKISHHLFDFKNKKRSNQIFKSSNYPAFCAYIVDNHIYVVQDSKKIKSLCQSSNGNKLSSQKIEEMSSEEGPLSGKEYYFIDIADKKDKIENMKNIAEKFNSLTNTVICVDIPNLFGFLIYMFHQGVSLKCKYSNNNVERIYHKKNGNVLISSPNLTFNVDHKTTKTVCEKLGIDFNNNSISSIAWNLLNKLYGIKQNRKQVTDENKEIILNLQKNKCKACDKALEKKKYHFDHIIRLENGGSNDNSNIQALCVACHDDKTDKENSDKFFKIHPLESGMNQVTEEIFNSSKNSFVDGIGFEAESVRGIDRSKSRRNILKYNTYSYPVYTSLDFPVACEIKSAKEIVCGSYYVETEDLSLYKGSDWYSAPRILKGLANGIIKTSDIKYKLIPSSVIPGNYFAKFVDKVLETQKEGDGLDNLWKAIPNTLIGCMGSKVSKIGQLFITNNKQTAAYASMEYNSRVFANFFDEKTGDIHVDNNENSKLIYGVVSNYKIKKSNSMVPIYNQIIDIECCHMFDMVQKIKELEPTSEILYRNTDCVYFRIPNTFISNDVDRSRTLSFDDDADDTPVMKSIAPEIIQEKYNKINQHFQTLKYKDGTAIYKNIEIPKNGKIQLECKKRLTPYFFEYNYNNAPQYEVINDPGNVTDFFKQFATDLIQKNSSFLINGGAGVGKTTLSKEIIKQLKDSGKKVLVLTPTRKALKQIEGDTTLTSFFLKHEPSNTYSYDYIFVDEVSMMKELFYRFFQILKSNNDNLKLIFSGDFKQLEPTKDVKKYDYENSFLLGKLVDNVKVLLSICRRSKDDPKAQQLFNLCHHTDLTKIDIYKVLKSKECEYSLTYLNKFRIEKNKYWMERIQKKNKSKFMVVPKNIRNKHSQDTMLMNSLPLIATKNCLRMGIVNSVEYVVVSWNENEFVIVEKNKDKKNKENHILISNVNLITEYFHPGYCISLTKAQGSTFRCEYTIYGWNIMTSTHKYVAISRSSRFDLINVKDVPVDYECDEDDDCEYDNEDIAEDIDLDNDFEDLYF